MSSRYQVLRVVNELLLMPSTKLDCGKKKRELIFRVNRKDSIAFVQLYKEIKLFPRKGTASCRLKDTHSDEEIFGLCPFIYFPRSKEFNSIRDNEVFLNNFFFTSLLPFRIQVFFNFNNCIRDIVVVKFLHKPQSHVLSKFCLKLYCT